MGEPVENEESSPPEAAAAAPPAEEPKPAEEAAEEPIPDKGPPRGFFYYFNPVNLFRRESPEMYIKEGKNLEEHQNLALATMAYQKAISLDKSRPEGFKGLGHVFLKKGGRSNLEAALKNFKEATLRNPFDDQVFAISAKIYERLGKLKEATMEKKKMMIVKTLQTDAKNPIANNNMGILLLQQGQTKQALEYFKKSIDANPLYDVALRNLATAHYKTAAEGKDENIRQDAILKAKGFIGKALEATVNAPSLVVQGKIFVLESRLEDALRVCEEAEELDHASKGVFALKRIVLEKMNRTAEAQEAFDSMKAVSE